MKKLLTSAVAILLSLSFSITALPVSADANVTVGIEYESLFGEWSGNGEYNAYYLANGAKSYTKIDNALIRNDGNGGYRVDVLGLRGGVKYKIKVVPVSNGKEIESEAFTFEGVPKKFDRSGFAFFQNKDNPGAYLADGTLPKSASVIYVNDENKNSISFNGKKGLANILNAQQSNSEPLVIRIIGKIDKPSGLSTGMLSFRSGSGFTIEGVGTDACIYGWGFNISDTDDLEIRNIKFSWNYEDAIGVQKSKHLWIHDNTFTVGNQTPPTEDDKGHGDGSCDIKRSNFVTVSYNHFIGTAKTSLLGSSASSREDTGNLSYHHNFFDGTEQRTPRVRWHNVHAYNNYYKSAGYNVDNGSEIGYGIAATCNSSIFSENNYFENTFRPLFTSDATEEALSKNDGGVIKEFGSVFDNCTGMKEKDCFVASDKYQKLTAKDYTCTKGGWTYNNFDTDSKNFYVDDYMLESAEQAKATVVASAGVQQRTGLTLTNKINGSSVSTGDDGGDSEFVTEPDEPTTETTTETTTESTTESATETTTESTTETTTETTTESTTETTTETTTESTTEPTTETTTEPKLIFGDADNDGDVDAADAALVLQYVLNKNAIVIDSEFEKRCDVDGEKGITASDSALILQSVLDSGFKPVDSSHF